MKNAHKWLVVISIALFVTIAGTTILNPEIFQGNFQRKLQKMVSEKNLQPTKQKTKTQSREQVKKKVERKIEKRTTAKQQKTSAKRTICGPSFPLVGPELGPVNDIVYACTLQEGAKTLTIINDLNTATNGGVYLENEVVQIIRYDIQSPNSSRPDHDSDGDFDIHDMYKELLTRYGASTWTGLSDDNKNKLMTDLFLNGNSYLNTDPSCTPPLSIPTGSQNTFDMSGASREYDLAIAIGRTADISFAVNDSGAANPCGTGANIWGLDYHTVVSCKRKGLGTSGEYLIPEKIGFINIVHDARKETVLHLSNFFPDFGYPNENRCPAGSGLGSSSGS